MEQNKGYITVSKNIYNLVFLYKSEWKVIERKWHVEMDFKSRSSVITTLVHIVPDNNVNQQKEKKNVISFVMESLHLKGGGLANY